MVLPFPCRLRSTQYDQIMSRLDVLSQENAQLRNNLQTRGTTAASPDNPILIMKKGKPPIQGH
jgi:hypothetical protein